MLERHDHPTAATVVTEEVARLHVSDEERVSAHVELGGAPLVIEGGCQAWHAAKVWAPAYLTERLGHVDVRYKVSSSNAHPDFRERLPERMFARGSSSFAAFLERLTTGSPEERARYLFTGDEEFLLRQRDGTRALHPGLAPLLDDVAVPPLVPPARLYTVWAWFSAAHVRTWLHYDNNGCHNLNAQLTGEKRCSLFAPSEVGRLHPFLLGGPNPAHNCSEIDIDRPDFGRFPEFAAAPRWETTLAAGDLLFIPAWWWHSFLHLGAFNSNVNFWWKPKAPRECAVSKRQALLDFAGAAGFGAPTPRAARLLLQQLDQAASGGDPPGGTT